MVPKQVKSKKKKKIAVGFTTKCSVVHYFNVVPLTM